MKKAVLITLVVLAVGGGLILAGQKAEPAQAKERDQAFLQSMVPHHESAISMAQVAKERATVPEIKQLANDIVGAQEKELAQMRTIHQRLFNAALTSDEGAHDKLELSADEAGMNHGAESTTKLRTANPFDSAFIDEMTPHHEGAVRMAKAVLETTEDAEIRQLAQDIVSAQEAEVKLMKDVRTRVYGSSATPSDASPSSSASPSFGGGHGGH